MSEPEDQPEEKAEVEEEVINPDARKGTIKSIKLSEPFESGEMIYYLDFCEPTVKHLRKYGATGLIEIKDGKQVIKFDMEVICLYIEKLCAIGKDHANKISMKPIRNKEGEITGPSDFDRAKEVVLGFLPVV